MRNADQKVWELLALEVQEGIEDIDGARTNVDLAVDRVLVDTRFAILLAPRQEAMAPKRAVTA